MNVEADGYLVTCQNALSAPLYTVAVGQLVPTHANNHLEQKGCSEQRIAMNCASFGLFLRFYILLKTIQIVFTTIKSTWVN